MLPVAQVLEKYGLAFQADQWRGASQYHLLCPFHAEATPSFDIDAREGVFNCFGCGAKGGLVDLVARLGRVSSFEAIKIIHDLRKAPVNGDGRVDPPDDEVERVPVDVALVWQAMHVVDWENVSSEHPVASYLLGRGFHRKTLQAFDVRLTEDAEYPFAVPIRRGRELLGYVKRRIAPGPKKYLHNHGFELVRSFAYYKFADEPCFTVEGSLDMMKAAQFGARHVCALLSWRMSDEKAEWFRATGIKDIVCALDNTPTGRLGYLRMRHVLPEVRIRQFQFPEHKKDVGDLSPHEYAWGMP